MMYLILIARSIESGVTESRFGPCSSRVWLRMPRT